MNWKDRDFIIASPASRPVFGRKAEGRQIYELVEDYVFHLAGFGHIVVPCAFQWDGASVPWVATRLFPSRGDSDGGACGHDWLYATERYPRVVCDNIFRRLLAITESSQWKVSVMFMAVRAGGWVGWNAHTKESVEMWRALAPWDTFPKLRF